MFALLAALSLLHPQAGGPELHLDLAAPASARTPVVPPPALDVNGGDAVATPPATTDRSAGLRLTLEALAGAGSAAALIFGGGGLAYAAMENGGDSSRCAAACATIFLTSAAATLLVPPLAVHAVATADGSSGSYLATLIGNALGLGLAGVVIDQGVGGEAALISLLVAPLAFEMLAAELVRGPAERVDPGW